jgi:phytoene desaturase
MFKAAASKQPKSAIIIGAGPGGLAAAMMLANAGVQVRVIERLPSVGGRCSSIQEQGYRFDLGPTFFLYPKVLERIYKLLGRDLHQEVPMVRLDPQYRVMFGEKGGDILCTPNIQKMAEAVGKLNAEDGRNVQRFIDENRVKLESFRPVLESPFSSWRDLISWDLVKLLPILRPWKSVDGELHRYFQDPRTRLAFSFQSKYLGMSPFNCPSLFTILSYLEYDYGVWHPIGGCNAVSEGMARTATELGATISLNESVTEVLFEGKKAIGVKTNQGTFMADAIIINADFARSMQKLVPNELRKRWTDEKLAKKRYSCSTFMLYFGIEGRYDHLHHHTIYTSSDYLGNLADIETHQRLSADPSFYIQNASITDDTLAPKGHSTLYVLVPVPHKSANIDWAKEQGAFRNKIIKQLEKVGIHDLEGRIRYEKMITPADWENQYEVYNGATFNLAHNLGQMLHLRPNNRFEDLGNVYLVGGGTHPGSGLPVIYESARISSRLLLQDMGLDATWLGQPGAPDEAPVLAAT